MISFQALRAKFSSLASFWQASPAQQKLRSEAHGPAQSQGWATVSYQEIVENQTELICRYRVDGTILYVNPSYCRYFGISQEDMIGKRYEPMIYAVDREAVQQQVQGMSRDRPQTVIENRVVVAGQVRWTQWHNRCFCNDAGDIVAYQSVGRDISKLKRVEAELRQSEQRYRTLNETLEQRIAERTAEIAAANASLKQEIRERLQAETRLKASEERFRRAIVDAPFPIIIHGEDGRILQMSQVTLDITGYAADQIPTLDAWVERVYGDGRGQISGKIHALYDCNERVQEGEFAIRTCSGQRRTWLFSSAPLGRADDGTKLVISMAADVTEQKRTEATLATRLRQQAAMTQLSQTALSGLELRELFAETTQLLATSLSVDYAKVLQLSPDGQSLKLLSGVGWQPGLVGQAMVDAHARSQAGYTLMAQNPVVVEDLSAETRFNGPPLLKNHGVISGISTIIQGVGDQPFGVLGVHSTRQRLFTQNDVNFLQAVANLLAAAINRKYTEQELQQLNQTLEQRVKERTQALEEVNQELEAFSYSVAHDLRAPLRSIQGFAQVLVEDYGQVLDHLGRDYIRRMAASAEHLDVLVQDLLTYSRLGRTAINLQPVNLSSMIDSILADLQPLIQAEGAELTVASQLPTVQAQRSILKQVLTNFIDNSIKFVAPEQRPKIRIWAEVREPDNGNSGQSARWVRLWVEDQGIGIAPSHQSRIFEAFERLHGVEAYAGTGIGLAIVKRGMERLGGRVGVESGLHRGSRFWIELPVADGNHQLSQENR